MKLSCGGILVSPENFKSIRVIRDQKTDMDNVDVCTFNGIMRIFSIYNQRTDLKNSPAVRFVELLLQKLRIQVFRSYKPLEDYDLGKALFVQTTYSDDEIYWVNAKHIRQVRIDSKQTTFGEEYTVFVENSFSEEYPVIHTHDRTVAENYVNMLLKILQESVIEVEKLVRDFVCW